jgi:hypothetical protein
MAIWINQNSIFLTQMGSNIVRKGAGSVFWAIVCNLLSNMGAEALWLGDV